MKISPCGCSVGDGRGGGSRKSFSWGENGRHICENELPNVCSERWLSTPSIFLSGSVPPSARLCIRSVLQIFSSCILLAWCPGELLLRAVARRSCSSSHSSRLPRRPLSFFPGSSLVTLRSQIESVPLPSSSRAPCLLPRPSLRFLSTCLGPAPPPNPPWLTAHARPSWSPPNHCKCKALVPAAAAGDEAEAEAEAHALGREVEELEEGLADLDRCVLEHVRGTATRLADAAVDRLAALRSPARQPGISSSL